MQVDATSTFKLSRGSTVGECWTYKTFSISKAQTQLVTLLTASNRGERVRVVQKCATIDPFGQPKTSERCNMAAQQILQTRYPNDIPSQLFNSGMIKFECVRYGTCWNCPTRTCKPEHLRLLHRSRAIERPDRNNAWEQEKDKIQLSTRIPTQMSQSIGDQPLTYYCTLSTRIFSIP